MVSWSRNFLVILAFSTWLLTCPFLGPTTLQHPFLKTALCRSVPILLVHLSCPPKIALIHGLLIKKFLQILLRLAIGIPKRSWRKVRKLIPQLCSCSRSLKPIAIGKLKRNWRRIRMLSLCLHKFYLALLWPESPINFALFRFIVALGAFVSFFVSSSPFVASSLRRASYLPYLLDYN